MQKMLESAPGAVWAALIVGLVLLADWLAQYFGGLAWVPPVAGLLTADEDRSRDMYTKSVLIKSILIHSFQGA